MYTQNLMFGRGNPLKVAHLEMAHSHPDCDLCLTLKRLAVMAHRLVLCTLNVAQTAGEHSNRCRAGVGQRKAEIDCVYF